jgi:hypothetical protein
VLYGDDGDDLLQALDGSVDTLYGGAGTDTARLGVERDSNDEILLSDIEVL